MTAFSEEDEQNIQGIGLGRFRKDHQEVLFIRFGTGEGARALIGKLAPRVANLWEVKRFNEIFKEISERPAAGGREGVVEATWLGVGISARGYRTLGVDLEELGNSTGAEAFKEGMAKRSGEQIADRPEDQPEEWLEPFKPTGGVDAILVIAADDECSLDHEVVEVARAIHEAGASIVIQERGDTLPGALTGHEHFGFKDGVSQPAVEELGEVPAEHEPGVLAAGEFVLGHPNHAGPSPITGELRMNGSYGVFRRLRQNVAAFRDQAAAMASPTPAAGEATSPALNAAQLEAKLVGRWPSGAPTDPQPESDPGKSGVSNAFDYSEDPEGERTPRFAHIRKVNPRNEAREDSEQQPAQNHRMIRAGIPTATHYPPAPPTTAPTGDCTSWRSSPTSTSSSGSSNDCGRAGRTSRVDSPKQTASTTPDPRSRRTESTRSSVHTQLATISHFTRQAQFTSSHSEARPCA